MNNVIVEAKGVKTYFKQQKGIFQKNGAAIKAVDNINLKIYEGETLGLVGESGCGKSTFGKTILNLVPATEGEISFKGENITNLSSSAMWEYRKRMQLIFQNPYSSLNPRMTIRESVEAPLKVYKKEKKVIDDKVQEILEDVGLGARYLERFPHEFSGGQRQRIVIARALILDPEFVVCDEPVSALDVSVRAQVLNLMRELQEKRNLTYLFISHDLSVVKHISDRVAVMYLGNIIELADKDELFQNPGHPYTQALLSAIPIPSVEKRRKRIHLQGDIANVYDMPKGCKFHTRCPYAEEKCKSIEPEMKEIAEGHFCACHRCKCH